MFGFPVARPLVCCGLAMFAAGCARAEGTSAPRAASPVGEDVSAPIVVEPFGPPAPALPTTPLRVLVGGDLIPHRPSLAAPAAIRTALAPLGPLFASADAVVANYEAATGELDKKAFRLAYAAAPEWLGSLPPAGIKVVSVANNHACDLGIDGVEATLDAAAESGITALGGDAKGDPWQPRLIVERSGKRICGIAWTTLINADGACAKTTRLAMATADTAGRKKIAAAIAHARSVCDATIAIIHGGVEYVPQTPAVMAVARQAADSGADAVVVHHPHIASPVVVHRAKDGRKVPIFASVGNLVSNQGESWKPPMFPVLRENRRLVCVNGWTRLGVLADLAFDFSVRPKLEWSFHLLWTDNEHAEDRAPIPKIATRVLDPAKDEAILSRLAEDSVGPVELFDDPCWIERPIYTEGDRERDPRCETSLVGAAPPPGAVARAPNASNAANRNANKAAKKKR